MQLRRIPCFCVCICRNWAKSLKRYTCAVSSIADATFLVFWDCAKSLKRYACEVGRIKNKYKLEVPKRRPAIPRARSPGPLAIGSRSGDVVDLDAVSIHAEASKRYACAVGCSYAKFHVFLLAFV